MILRQEYRGCLKEGICEEKLTEALKKAALEAESLKQAGKLLTVCVYRYKNMVFLYQEALAEGVDPEEYLTDLAPYLAQWPEEHGPRCWAKMYAIYWHSVPQDPESWVRERASNEVRIGRIAFLKYEKVFNYAYYHHGIVQEGLLKGDKYQYISMHENILFSYFEEPRHNVNISGLDEPSKVVQGWAAVDPESHFEMKEGQKANFMVLPHILMV